MAKVYLALREDISTVCMLEGADSVNTDICQISTFARNLLGPDYIGKYMYFYPYSTKYNGEVTKLQMEFEDHGVTPDPQYVAKIESEVEFLIDASAIRYIAKEYMPEWNAVSYLNYFTGRTSGFLLFLKIYRVPNPINSKYFEKGSRGSYQVFSLYDSSGNEKEIVINDLQPIISDNKFNYIKDEMIHQLKVDDVFIAEYSNSKQGISELKDRYEADKEIRGTRKSWKNRHLQWLDEENDDVSDEDFDMAQLDYNAIYNEVERLYPSMQSVVKWIRGLRAARLGEYGYYLKNVHKRNERARESAERIFEMSVRSALKTALNAYKNDGIDLEDAFQEACIGIWTSIWKHHEEVRGLFPSYCATWMRQNMRRSLPYFQPNCRYPAHYEEYVNKKLIELKSVVGELNFDSLETDELYELLRENTSCDKENALRLSYLLIPPKSIEILVEQGENEEFSDHGQEARRVNNSLFTEYIVQVLAQALDMLKEREKIVIEMRNGLNGYSISTLQEIGNKMSITRERARQIEAKALRKIVKHLYKRHIVGKSVFNKYFNEDGKPIKHTIHQSLSIDEKIDEEDSKNKNKMG